MIDRFDVIYKETTAKVTTLKNEYKQTEQTRDQLFSDIAVLMTDYANETQYFDELTRLSSWNQRLLTDVKVQPYPSTEFKLLPQQLLDKNALYVTTIMKYRALEQQLKSTELLVQQIERYRAAYAKIQQKISAMNTADHTNLKKGLQELLAYLDKQSDLKKLAQQVMVLEETVKLLNSKNYEYTPGYSKAVRHIDGRDNVTPLLIAFEILTYCSVPFLELGIIFVCNGMVPLSTSIPLLILGSLIMTAAIGCLVYAIMHPESGLAERVTPVNKACETLFQAAELNQQYLTAMDALKIHQTKFKTNSMIARFTATDSYTMIKNIAKNVPQFKTKQMEAVVSDNIDAVRDKTKQITKANVKNQAFLLPILNEVVKMLRSGKPEESQRVLKKYQQLQKQKTGLFTQVDPKRIELYQAITALAAADYQLKGHKSIQNFTQTIPMQMI